MRFNSSISTVNATTCGSCSMCLTTRLAFNPLMNSGFPFSVNISPYCEYGGWHFFDLFFEKRSPLQNSSSAMMSLTALHATVIISVARRTTRQSLRSNFWLHFVWCDLLALQRLLQNQTSMQCGHWILNSEFLPHSKQPVLVWIKLAMLANGFAIMMHLSTSMSSVAMMCFPNVRFSLKHKTLAIFGNDSLAAKLSWIKFLAGFLDRGCVSNVLDCCAFLLVMPCTFIQIKFEIISRLRTIEKYGYNFVKKKTV